MPSRPTRGRQRVQVSPSGPTSSLGNASLILARADWCACISSFIGASTFTTAVSWRSTVTMLHPAAMRPSVCNQSVKYWVACRPLSTAQDDDAHGCRTSIRQRSRIRGTVVKPRRQ